MNKVYLLPEINIGGFKMAENRHEPLGLMMKKC